MLAPRGRSCDDEASLVSNAVATSNQDPPVTPGTILAGKYRVERVLGQGGMGLVVEARHMALDERVALKFLLPEYAKHPEASARFLREARAAVKIKSEHVARVSDVGTLDNGSPYMVMEFLNGADLAQTLMSSGVLSASDAVDYIIQACEAIAEAHSYSIVHRDLKPANLFLTSRPDGSPLIKVLDFGISKVTNNPTENLTKTTAAMGSALYMSPEQMRQTRSVDHRTDIYALGISLFELVAGRQPFYADTLPQLCAEILTGTPTPLSQLRPDLTENFAEVLGRAYERDVSRRYQSIAEFVIALAPFASTAAYTTIERIARLGGVSVPEFIAQRGSNPPERQGSQPSLSRQSNPQILETAKTAPMPAVDPMQMQDTEIRPSPVPNQILLTPYQAPVSQRAAEAFATSNITPSGMTTSTPSSPRSGGGSGKMIAVAVGIVSLLALTGVALALALRKPEPSAPAAPVETQAVTAVPLPTTPGEAKTAKVEVPPQNDEKNDEKDENTEVDAGAAGVGSVAPPGTDKKPPPPPPPVKPRAPAAPSATATQNADPLQIGGARKR